MTMIRGSGGGWRVRKRIFIKVKRIEAWKVLKEKGKEPRLAIQTLNLAVTRLLFLGSF
jgi:hypothetical protein